MKPAAAFPDDLAACHAMLADNARALATKDGVIEQLEDRVEEQKRELAKALAERDAALQLAFRKRQERYLDDPNQFLLDFGDTADARSFVEGTPMRQTSRKKLPPAVRRGLARSATSSCLNISRDTR
jgi:hypothetical protein